MEQNLFEALKLMAVGMVTVFVILLIVINMGKLLIYLVNKYAPEEAESPKKLAKATTAAVQTVDAGVKAVLDAAVAQITGGKGRISRITRI